MKTYVIGDIHGALKAFKQVFIRAPIKLGDTLIFLGDYVDGWSESSELIEELINLQENYNCIFLRGNHDTWCEEWLNRGLTPAMWLMQGGKATVESYMKTEYLIKDSHRLFFSKLHNYYIDDQNRAFIHAGFVSRKGVGHEKYQSNYYWDRDLWTLALLQHNNYQERDDQTLENVRRFEKHKEVFIGHTSTNNWNCKPHYPEYKDPNQTTKNGSILVPMHRCNVWNLDTGCGWGGKLTIMDVNTKEYWQSDLVTELYLNEKGR